MVLGTGRSGTSEVAEILHEELGVHMGSAFHMPDEFNPRGYYEDREAQAEHLAFYMAYLDEISDKKAWDIWLKRFDTFLAKKQEPWGLKDPGVVDIPRLAEQYFHLNPRYIICERDREDTIGSLMRFKKITRPEAEEIMDRRIARNEEITRGEALRIDCYAKDKKEQIETWLKK
jgi:hypothetical protein